MSEKVAILPGKSLTGIKYSRKPRGNVVKQPLPKADCGSAGVKFRATGGSVLKCETAAGQTRREHQPATVSNLTVKAGVIHSAVDDAAPM